MAQQVIRKAPVIGPQLSERFNPDTEVLGGVLDRVRADFTRIMSGLQAAESEQARLLRTLPDIGTVDYATAVKKLDEFEAGIKAYIEERARLRPDLFRTGENAALLKEYGIKSSSGGAGGSGDNRGGVSLQEIYDAIPERN